MAGYPPGLLRDPLCFLAAGFGSGCSPWAPGTMGTLVGLPLALLFSTLPWFVGLAGLLVMALAGIFICQHAGTKSGIQDHPGIVWDEIVGICITLYALPPSLLNYSVGFLLFRVFDIWKPWPIGWLDRNIKGGLGVMLDDWVAAIISALVLNGFIYYWPKISY